MLLSGTCAGSQVGANSNAQKASSRLRYRKGSSCRTFPGPSACSAAFDELDGGLTVLPASLVDISAFSGSVIDATNAKNSEKENQDSIEAFGLNLHFSVLLASFLILIRSCLALVPGRAPAFLPTEMVIGSRSNLRQLRASSDISSIWLSCRLASSGHFPTGLHWERYRAASCSFQ